MGCLEDEIQLLDNRLFSKVGKLLIQYLGLILGLIIGRRPYVIQCWRSLRENIQSGIEKYLSMGGRMPLIKAMLSNFIVNVFTKMSGMVRKRLNHL